MTLGFLLPLCLAYLLFDLIRRLKPALDLREVILIDAVVLGISIALGTELLSLFHGLTSGTVLLWWILECLVVNYYRLKAPAAQPLQVALSPGRFFRETSWDSLGMLLVLVIFSFVLMLVGLVAVPNNYDSMTYHLARMAHWQQDESIAFYGTNIPRQNFMPPWAEWALLQLTLLQGSDQLVNLLQGTCYIGCMIGAGLVTSLLGGGRRENILAAFFVGTLPLAIFEATSTQNDLVMSFWIICAVYACLKLTRQPDWLGTFTFGASLGLGMLTKTVTMILGLPFCLWVLWALGRRGLRQALPHLVVIGLLTVALNAGHAARNLATSGHLFGPEEYDKNGSHYTNDIHTPGVVFSNLLRNLGLHANLFHHKEAAEQAIIKIHHALGIDPNDPRTTSNHGTFNIWEGGEDGSPMPFHLVMIFVTFAVLAWNSSRLDRLSLALAASVITGTLLFCLILKWWPFNARLHLPLFIMSAPCVALVMGRIFRQWVSLPVMVLFLVISLPDVFWYMPRAALGPISVFVTSDDFQQLFRQPQLARPYLEAKQLLDTNHASEVGLICKEDDWEYPFLVTHRQTAPWRVDHVLIENAYAPLETSRAPDVLLCTRAGLDDVVTVHGNRYHLARKYLDRPDGDLVLSIYLPENTASETPHP